MRQTPMQVVRVSSARSVTATWERRDNLRVLSVMTLVAAAATTFATPARADACFNHRVALAAYEAASNLYLEHLSERYNSKQAERDFDEEREKYLAISYQHVRAEVELWKARKEVLPYLKNGNAAKTLTLLFSLDELWLEVHQSMVDWQSHSARLESSLIDVVSKVGSIREPIEEAIDAAIHEACR